MAGYTAEDIYSTKRAEIQGKIRERAEAMLGEKLVVGGESEEVEANAPYSVPLYAMLNLIDTLILGIELPTAVVGAINRKIEQYYISEEYKFRVAREIRESERKKIEADGIHEFQQIVSQGISDSILALAGYRGDTSASAIFQFQNRGSRHRQGWLAGHSGQLRQITTAADRERGRCSRGKDATCRSSYLLGKSAAGYPNEAIADDAVHSIPVSTSPDFNGFPTYQSGHRSG